MNETFCAFIRHLACKALGTVGIAIVSSLLLLPVANAALVNEETGEGYIPQLNEDGELEEPPEWVYENQQSQGIYNNYLEDADVPPFTGEISVDACSSETQVWTGLDALPGDMLHESIEDDAIHDDFVALIDNLLYIISADISWASPLVDVHSAEVASFQCQTPYELLDCLGDGFDMFWCKSYINAPSFIHSKIVVEMNLTALGETGDVTVHGTLDYREVFEASVLEKKLACINISYIETTFGDFIANKIHDILTDDGDWCQIF